MKLKARKIVLYGSLFLLVLDQLTKAAAQRYLAWYDVPSKRFLGLIDFKFTVNSGMLLGLGNKSPGTVWIGIILGFLLIFALIYGFRYYNKKYLSSSLYPIAFCFCISSIAGNLFDRIFLGAGRDFIVWFGPGIFNLADFYIWPAIIIYLWAMLKTRRGKSEFTGNNRSHPDIASRPTR